MLYDIVLYHANCSDGFTAAWVMKGSGLVKEDAEYVAVNYGGDEPYDVTDKHVLIVDFSYPAERLRGMVEFGGAKTITILDHHKTAQEALDEFIVGVDGEVNLDDPEVFWQGCVDLELEPIRAWFDMDRSGAQLAWSYVYGFEPSVNDGCALVEYVGTRDLWRLDDLPGIRQVHAWLMSHDYDFDVWSTLQVHLEDHMSNVIEEGYAILKAHDKNVREAVKSSRRQMIIGGHTVSVANVPKSMASDAAHLMAIEPGAPFAVAYFDNAKGQREFSLRSSKEHGIDVSEIVKQYGGGGHKNAAGFSIRYDPLYHGEFRAIDGVEVVPTIENASD